jgi:hypothetical protein
MFEAPARHTLNLIGQDLKVIAETTTTIIRPYKKTPIYMEALNFAFFFT